MCAWTETVGRLRSGPTQSRLSDWAWQFHGLDPHDHTRILVKDRSSQTSEISPLLLQESHSEKQVYPSLMLLLVCHEQPIDLFFGEQTLVSVDLRASVQRPSSKQLGKRICLVGSS